MINIGISPEYLLDEMSIDEIESILKAREEIRKEEWEKVRFQCFYSVVSVNGGKHFKRPGDLFRLPWEKKKKDKKGRKYTADEIKRKERAVEKYINLNGKRV